MFKRSSVLHVGKIVLRLCLHKLHSLWWGLAECALEINLNVRNPAPLFSSREICTARIPARVYVSVCLFVGMSAGKASRN
jgi:hypothetical protein